MNCQYDQMNFERHFLMQALHEHNPGLWRTMWPLPKSKKMLEKFMNWTRSSPSPKSKAYLQKHLASKQRLVRNYCSIFPYQVIKIVRLNLATLAQLLDDST